jgi:site-specific recombinase XerC
LLDVITFRFATPVPPPPKATLPALNPSYRRTLRAETKAKRTTKPYTQPAGPLTDLPTARGHPPTMNTAQHTRHDFTNQRDTAILRLLIDTSVPITQAAAIPLPDDLHLDDQDAIDLGKGRHQRAAPSTARPLSPWTATCASAPATRSRTCLTCGPAGGAMTLSRSVPGVAARGASVGLPGLHPHQFRHSFVDAWLSAGGNEGDLMRLAGW